MVEHSNEIKPRLNPEVLRSEIEQKVSKFLEDEQSFSGGKYGALNLPASALAEWKDRPVINEAFEPLKTTGDIRIILVDKEVGEAYKSIHLDIVPEGEKPRVKYVYILHFTPDKAPKLISYEDRPIPHWTPTSEPAPMLPVNMVTIDAPPSVLQAFNRFLDKAKAVSPEEGKTPKSV